MSNGGKKFPFKRKWAFARKVASDRQLTVAVFLLVTAVLALFFGVFSYKHPEKSPVNGRFALSFQPVDENMKYNLVIRNRGEHKGLPTKEEVIKLLMEENNGRI